MVGELKFGLVLQVASVLSATHTTLETRILQAVKALGYRIRGVFSDDERAVCLAVAYMWPGVAHQTCQWHCLREAAAPLLAADQARKKALKQARGARPYRRDLCPALATALRLLCLA